MKKKEWVYREILYQVLENRNERLTQQFLSEKCEVSIGNVNYSLEPLERMNSIEKRPRSFLVLNPKKILVYWASVRNLDKEVIYKTHVDKSVRKIEKEMPPCLFTAYTAFKHRYGEPPADYSEVYVYAEGKRVEERFPKRKGKENIFVLELDKHLEKFEKVPLAQLYVDLWNLGTWYAQDFLKDLEEKLNGILER